MTAKLLIAFLCAVSGAMIGVCLYKRSKSECDYLSQLVGLCDKLYQDIDFRNEPVPVLLNEFKCTCSKRLSDRIDMYLSGSYNAKGKLSAKALTVDSFFGELGKTDREGQVSMIKGYRQKFNNYYAEAEKKHKTYSSLYIKLGFLAGLAVGILIW